MTKVEKLQAKIKELEHRIETLKLDYEQGIIRIAAMHYGSKAYWTLAIMPNTCPKTVLDAHDVVFKAATRQDIVAFIKRLIDDLSGVYERVLQDSMEVDDDAD